MIDFFTRYIGIVTALSVFGVASAQIQDSRNLYEPDIVLKTPKSSAPSAGEQKFKLLLSLAQKGHVQEMELVALSYENGLGVGESPALADFWYRKAAEGGSLGAQKMLGFSYLSGSGVKKNHKEAAKWYLMAARSGDVRAQNTIGMMYNLGLGVEQNEQEAIRWHQKAAKLGSKAAIKLLDLHKTGAPIDRDLLKKLLDDWTPEAIPSPPNTMAARPSINQPDARDSLPQDKCFKTLNFGDSKAEVEAKLREIKKSPIEISGITFSLEPEYYDFKTTASLGQDLRLRKVFLRSCCASWPAEFHGIITLNWLDERREQARIKSTAEKDQFENARISKDIIRLAEKAKVELNEVKSVLSRIHGPPTTYATNDVPHAVIEKSLVESQKYSHVHAVWSSPQRTIGLFTFFESKTLHYTVRENLLGKADKKAVFYKYQPDIVIYSDKLENRISESESKRVPKGLKDF